MPGMDRKGPPFGDGNQSGRRMGKCNPENKNIESSDEERSFGKGRMNRFQSNTDNGPNDQSISNRGLGKGRGRNANQS